MSYVSLREFQEVTGISDRAMLEILKRNQLSCQLDEEHGIMVELESADAEQLIEVVVTSERDRFTADKGLIRERFRTIIVERLNEIIDDVVEQQAQLTNGKD